MKILDLMEPWMSWFLESYFEIATERPAGFGPSPIPWSKIMDYGRHHGLEGQLLQIFQTIMRILDNRVLEKNGKPETIRDEDASTRKKG